MTALTALAATIITPAAAEQRQTRLVGTHLHTSYSLDAYLLGNKSAIDTAYRFAKGLPVVHPDTAGGCALTGLRLSGGDGSCGVFEHFRRD